LDNDLRIGKLEEMAIEEMPGRSRLRIAPIIAF
jgi:hypothetical protein